MLEYGTLKQIRDQAARMVGDTSSSMQERIDEWINTHYSKIARLHRWPQLLRTSEEAISYSAGSTYVYLPKEVESVLFIMPANLDAAQNMALDQMLRAASTEFQTSGEFCRWAEAGEYGRRVDFHTAAEQITLTTSGASSVAAVVQGTVTAAAPTATAQDMSETVTISPSTGGTTTNSYIELASVSVEELDAGITITATGASSGLVYATIGYGEQTARYKRLRLMQPPTAATAVTVLWKKRVRKLSLDNQAIEIPVGNALVSLAVATVFSNQRELGLFQMHQGMGDAEVQRVFDASSMQGEQIHQARPIGHSRGRRITVINPT